VGTAPVSLPVAWDELDDLGAGGPPRVGLREALALVVRQRVDPWARYVRVRQRLPLEAGDALPAGG
jgi:DNA primase